MKSITTHVACDLDKNVQCEVMDEFIPGTAPTGLENSQYKIYVRTNDFSQEVASLKFAKALEDRPGNVPVASGVTNEVLLAIVMDRLEGFQSPITGKFKCVENEHALRHLAEAMFWLQKRTRDRVARGVKGFLKA